MTELASWEYKTVLLARGGPGLPICGGDDPVDPADLEALLNLLGHEGWELVSILTTGHKLGAGGDAVAVFKRPSNGG